MPKEKIKNFFLIFAWGLYDLANQFFALNIVSLYFVRWLTLEMKAPEILYSITFGISAFFIAFCDSGQYSGGFLERYPWRKAAL